MYIPLGLAASFQQLQGYASDSFGGHAHYPFPAWVVRKSVPLYMLSLFRIRKGRNYGPKESAVEMDMHKQEFPRSGCYRKSSAHAYYDLAFRFIAFALKYAFLYFCATVHNPLFFNNALIAGCGSPSRSKATLT